jgi:biotin carboxylase
VARGAGGRRRSFARPARLDRADVRLTASAPDARARKRLLVLGAGPAQLGLLTAARRRGLFVVAADRDPRAAAFTLADRRAVVSAEDEHAVESLARAERVDGIIAPGIDWPVAIAARVAARLGLPHPVDPSAALRATSKVPQRQRLAEAGVPQPPWHTVGSPDAAAALDLRFPCVVKAPDRQGQRGLALVEDARRLEPAVAAALAASRARTCIVEELADGPEVTVNAFSLDGELVPLTVTDRLTADPPAFGVALAHAWPSELGVDRVAGAARVAGDAAAALGIVHGPTYTQLRVGRDGARVVEVAARLGGGHDAELCAAAVGVDLNGLALAAALGEPVEPDDVQPRGVVGGACVRFLVPPPGTLVEVTGIDAAVSSPGVVAVHVYRRPGHTFGPLRIGSDRAGAVLAVGDDRDDALARAGAAADLLRFHVDAETRADA